MIYRAEPHTLMLFNAVEGITAAVSGSELESMKAYLREGLRDEFISRLYELKLLPDVLSEDDKQNVLKTIEKTESITSPIASFAAPESLHIDLTTACPLACAQCYKDTSKGIVMSYESFTSIIKQAKNVGVFQIALGGGEPLSVKDLPRYVKYAASSGAACTVTTSGYGLTPDMLKQLTDSGLNHMQVSLNGSTKAVNSYSRDGYDEAIAALGLLSEGNVLFGINWVARRDNIHDFKAMISMAKKFGADNINILRYKPSLKEDYDRFELTKGEFHSLVQDIKNAKGIKLKVDSAFSNLLCTLYGNRMNPLHAGCGAGRRFMMVDPMGRLKPCSHLSAVSEEQDILEYWRNSPDLFKLRNMEEIMDGQCKSCKYLYSCRGCRAICERIYNNMNAGEHNCPAFNQKEML
ncbi:MAG: radical SAM protein [Clostridia bacterium]|nr:radical SAM protein [Clostridia bacterium]